MPFPQMSHLVATGMPHPKLFILLLKTFHPHCLGMKPKLFNTSPKALPPFLRPPSHSSWQRCWSTHSTHHILVRLWALELLETLFLPPDLGGRVLPILHGSTLGGRPFPPFDGVAVP